MYKLLHKTYILLSKMGINYHNRMYGRYCSKNKFVYDNKIKWDNECVKNDNIKKMRIDKYLDELFTCEITNKLKRIGQIDCNCERVCDVKKSEIQIIEDIINYKK